MRLHTKTTLYFLLAMVPLLAASGFYLFNQFSREINYRDDEELIKEEIQWISYLEAEAANGTTFVLRTTEIFIYPVDAPVTSYPTITDTEGFNAKQVKVPFRQLSHVVAIANISYQITLRKPQEQKTVLVANVTRIMLFVFAGLFVASLLFNWFISQSIWQPFKISLEKIRATELNKMQDVYFEETSIKEFNELNASLNSMTGKIYNYYINMKEFTENAAHEMQTPLAVVQSKLELLLQDNNLTDEQVDSITHASDALARLSKLNQSLLLLAKIENNQYSSDERVGFTGITNKYLRLFEEVITDKQVIIETHFNQDFILNIHPFLAETMISNLFGNAVKYNYPGGRIVISVNEREYIIENTSRLPAIEKEQLFKRFNIAKDRDATSTGLGLAIVKRIVDTHHLNIAYQAEDGMHRFKLTRNLTA